MFYFGVSNSHFTIKLDHKFDELDVLIIIQAIQYMYVQKITDPTSLAGFVK